VLTDAASPIVRETPPVLAGVRISTCRFKRSVAGNLNPKMQADFGCPCRGSAEWNFDRPEGRRWTPQFPQQTRLFHLSTQDQSGMEPGFGRVTFASCRVKFAKLETVRVAALKTGLRGMRWRPNRDRRTWHSQVRPMELCWNHSRTMARSVSFCRHDDDGKPTAGISASLRSSTRTVGKLESPATLDRAERCIAFDNRDVSVPFRVLKPFRFQDEYGARGWTHDRPDAAAACRASIPSAIDVRCSSSGTTAQSRFGEEKDRCLTVGERKQFTLECVTTADTNPLSIDPQRPLTGRLITQTDPHKSPRQTVGPPQEIQNTPYCNV